MQHRTIVLPEYLNDQGFLFGGNLLKWVDEYAYITATLPFPGNRFVTVSLDEVNFNHPVLPGEILCFDVNRVHRGNTSLKYSVEVMGEKLAGHDQPLFATHVSLPFLSTRLPSARTCTPLSLVKIWGRRAPLLAGHVLLWHYLYSA